jgi:hypothetical protein
MNIIIESIFIAAYTTNIYWFLYKFILDKNILFFVTGFLKHLLNSFLGFHTYYCQHGNRCKKYISGSNIIRQFSNKYIPKHLQIWTESIIEGILFILLGILFTKLINTHKYTIIFIIGFSLHFLFEIYGFHDNFCIDQCKRH